MLNGLRSSDRMAATTLRIRGAAGHNLEPIAVTVLAMAAFFLPGNVIGAWQAIPPGLLGTAIAQGSVLALNAIGVIIVYRSNRIINFAQGALGALAAYLFYNLISHREFIYLLGKAGAGVGSNTLTAPYALQMLNFLLSLVVCLIAGPLVGFLGYSLVMRWFRKVPPLTSTMATIGLTSLVSVGLGQLNSLNFWPPDHHPFQLPFDVVVSIGNIDIHFPELAAIAIAVGTTAGLALFFRRTSVGLALRGASGNAERAGTLGVPVTNVVTVAWVLAGLMSGLAGMLMAPSTTSAATLANGTPVDVLVRVLAVTVIARMTSIPIALLGAVCLAIIEQSLQWNLGSTAVFQAALVVMITAFLILRRDRRQRADVADETFTVAKVARPTPGVLRRHPVVRRYLVGGGLIVAAVLLVLPWLVSPGQVSGATTAIIGSMVGLSLLVLTGWAGQISLGHFGLAGMGAFVVAATAGSHGFSLPLPVALLAAGVSGALLATLIGIPALRLPGLNLAVVTLALALTMTAVVLNPVYLGRVLPSDLPRPSILGMNTSDERVFYYFALVVLAIVVVVVVGMRRSRLARGLIASRDNPHAAQSFGINLVTARLFAFAISGFIAALAGGLLALEQYGVRPQTFTADLSIQELLMTLVGGLGSVIGPLLSHTVFYVLPLINIPVVAALGLPLASLLLLLFYPSGFGGMAFAVRDAILRRVAVRYRIDVPSLFHGRPLDRRHGKAALAPRSRARAALGDEARYRITNQWSAGRTSAQEVRNEA